MPDWFEKNVHGLPPLSEVDWELAVRVQELLRPYALTSAPVRCEAKDTSGTYERSSVEDLKVAASERDSPPLTIRLFVNGSEDDGKTPRFLNIQQSCDPNFGSNARFIAGDRAAVAVLADRTPTLFASSPKVTSQPSPQRSRTHGPPPPLVQKTGRWWVPDPHDVVNQVIGGLILAAILTLAALLWHRGVFKSGNSEDGKSVRTRTAVAPGATERPTEGYAPANRRYFVCETPQTCPAVRYVTFNSFVNAPYSDERAFLDARLWNAPNPLVYHDHLPVEDGDQILLRIYIHNDASTEVLGRDASTARNVHLLVGLPTNENRRNSLYAQLRTTSARPPTVSDSVVLYGARPFSMSFNRGSPILATYRVKGRGAFITRALPGAQFTTDQSVRADFARFAGGFQHVAFITMLVAVRSL